MPMLIDQLRSALIRKDGAGLTDGQLLDCFVAGRDEAAFVALVRRHGRMVFGVCRRVLRNFHDAEDAFQATFLVLARKAGAIQSGETVGNWLYGVAYRTALEARSLSARRRVHECQVKELPHPKLQEEPLTDLRPMLDRELSRLPEKYRLPIILCALEGRTRREVARQLSVPEGTLSSRLAAGRKILARRLARHGFEFSAFAVVPALPAPALDKLAALANNKSTAGAVSASAFALAERVVSSMFMAKLKLAAVITVALATLVAIGVGGIGYGAGTGQQGDAQQIQQQLSDAKKKAADAQKLVQDLESRLQLARQREKEHVKADALKALGERFKYLVPVEIGKSEFKDDGKLEILEVWGTRPTIEIGGQYLVRGKYALPKDGTLYFWTTSTTPLKTSWYPRLVESGQQKGKRVEDPIIYPHLYLNDLQYSVPTLDLQTIHLPKGQGEFTLLHTMTGPGFFHLVMTERDNYSNAFANVYFGTGDNVLRK
jgi:RNA polymerase sigma factor (sigma-70 family)